MFRKINTEQKREKNASLTICKNLCKTLCKNIYSVTAGEIGNRSIPEDFIPYVNDYRINLFDIAFLSEEKVKLFKIDFRFVADYFVQMRKTGDYRENHDEVKHMQEILALMAVMTQDDRFETVLDYNTESDGKETKTMCDVPDRIEAKGKAEGIAVGKAEGIAVGKAEGIAVGKAEGIVVGKAEGIAVGKAEGIAVGKAEGIAEGRMKANIQAARKMLRSNKLTLEDIAEFTGLSPEKVRELSAGKLV